MTDQPAAPVGTDRGAEAPRSTLRERLREWVNGLVGRPRDDSLRGGLEELLEEHADSDSAKEAKERELLRNVLAAGDLRVHDVMVPRADIVAVEEEASLDQAVRLFASVGHSRLPVYRKALDDVIGMIHIKDLVRYWGQTRKVELARIARKTLFVPPSMRVLDLLLQMRAKRVHMALVIDEYGGVDGLVTIEDLVEQVVGEINDEHDEGEASFLLERPDGSLEADGRCPVEMLEQRLGKTLLDPEREEYIDTLGGVVFDLIGRVPQRGELIKHPSGVAFEVIDADPRRVKRLRIRKLDTARTTGTP